jgi:hypothetical protein
VRELGRLVPESKLKQAFVDEAPLEFRVHLASESAAVGALEIRELQ